MKPGPDRIPRLQDLPAAFSLLTRLPLRVGGSGEFPASSSWAWPVVGAAVGALGGAVAHVLAAAGTGTAIAALGAIACMIAATGALHEDGLADSADGLFGGGSAGERLGIMRDSRIGAFGAITICLFLIGRHAGVDELLQGGRAMGALIAAGAVSRAVMLIVFRLTPPARSDGLAASVGMPSNLAAGLGCCLAAAIALAAVGWDAAPVAAFALAAGIAFAWYARRRIGGVTGDVLGAIQQVAELVCLAGLVALM